MTSQSYQNKNVTSAKDSNTKTDGKKFEKVNYYQHQFLIVASSLLVLLVLVVLAGANVGQHFVSSEYKTVVGVDGAKDSIVPITKPALAVDIFGMRVNSKSEEGEI